jgi:hypothetical protein
MSVMLRTQNPEAAAAIDDSDHRPPYVGQIVLYHARPGEARMGRQVAPGTVMAVQDEDHIDVLIIYDADDFIFRQKLPRKTDQNPFNAWSFTDRDEKFYRPTDNPDYAPREDTNTLFSEVAKLKEKLADAHARLDAIFDDKKKSKR